MLFNCYIFGKTQEIFQIPKGAQKFLKKSKKTKINNLLVKKPMSLLKSFQREKINYFKNFTKTFSSAPTVSAIDIPFNFCYDYKSNNLFHKQIQWHLKNLQCNYSHNEMGHNYSILADNLLEIGYNLSSNIWQNNHKRFLSFIHNSSEKSLCKTFFVYIPFKYAGMRFNIGATYDTEGKISLEYFNLKNYHQLSLNKNLQWNYTTSQEIPLGRLLIQNKSIGIAIDTKLFKKMTFLPLLTLKLSNKNLKFVMGIFLSFKIKKILIHIIIQYNEKIIFNFQIIQIKKQLYQFLQYNSKKILNLSKLGRKIFRKTPLAIEKAKKTMKKYL